MSDLIKCSICTKEVKRSEACSRYADGYAHTECINDYITMDDALEEIEDMKAKLTAKEESIANLNDQIERMREREKALQELVYVAGYLRCAKCNFQGVYSNLNMQSGTVSANNKSHSCPNGCGPLWKISERDQRIEAQKSYEELWERDRWIPVSERLPDDCNVFYCVDYDQIYGVAYCKKGVWLSGTRVVYPTHWKPITPPTDKGEKA